ncbi:MAG: hypothetical protein CVU40_15380 [Chloroflexi bacterium HGW-Chloroflexi-2]|jgi:hypothetical protein|nr:MAG: hypothetical protein CVU40_15380 [Chloroflexi bacterium HGW-Chloroflexi-2]
MYKSIVGVKMKLFLIKIFRIMVVLGVIVSLGSNIFQVNANTNTQPVITTIDRNNNIPFSFTKQEIGVARTQKVNLNTSAFETIAQNLFSDIYTKQTARFQIFPELTLDATFNQIDHTIHAGYIMSGILNNDPDSSILIVSTDGTVSANLEFQGKQYQLRDNGQGLYRFEEVDQTQFPEELDIIPDLSESSDGIFEPLLETTSADSGYIIDVLVVYTAAARSGAGSTTNMLNQINLAVSETNTGYERSGIFSRMRLVYTAEINYDESILSTSTGWGTALSQLTNQDNVIDEVRSLRNTYGADLVVMIVNNMTFCGIGWLMTPGYTYDSVGNSLVSRACTTGYYSFAHETGHNMGAHHDRLNTGGGTAMYSYSYGYQAPDSSFRTIMAYNCSTGCSRVNNWSNPEVLYNGKPTGVVSTASNSADNRLTLNNTAPIVSNFRATKVVPVAPTNLVVQNVKSTDITVTFADNSTDELGFKVERSADGATWSSFLTLAANTTSFVDQSPVCASQFFYRVYAYNQNGNSSYSNIASTGLIDCSPPAPLTDIRVLPSISSITLDWQTTNDNITYLVQIQDELSRMMALDQGLEINQLPITLAGLEKGTTYIITITATNEFGTTVNDPITVQTMREVIYLPLTSKQ